MFKKIALCAVLVTSSVISAQTHLEKAFIEQAKHGNVKFVKSNVGGITRIKVLDKALRKAAGRASRILDRAAHLVVCNIISPLASQRGRYRAQKRLERVYSPVMIQQQGMLPEVAAA